MGEEDMERIASLLDRVAKLSVRIEEHGGEGGEEGEGGDGGVGEKKGKKKKSLKEFLLAVEEEPFKGEIAMLREEVELFSSRFPLPGLEP
jgi:hypothetical protein